MTPWLVIPVKTFKAGKSRLRPVLADKSRRALNEFLLRRMLAIAKSFAGSSRTVVISDCDRVLQVAATFNVQTVRQESGGGLNRAASQGITHVRRRGARDVLLIACDLPTLQLSDLRDVAATARHNKAVIICPDKHHTGTNAILLPAGAELRFRFGHGSLLGHCKEARQAGLASLVHFNSRVAFDVDTPRDLASWLGVERPSRSKSALDLPKLRSRLSSFVEWRKSRRHSTRNPTSVAQEVT